MRNIIPVMLLALTVLVGCQSPKTTVGGSTNAMTVTNTVVVTNTIAATPSVVGPNTPAQTTSENLVLGNLAAIFIVFLVILALKRE
jgi:hypothetical protein